MMMRSMANTGLLRRISNYRHLRRTGAHVHANEPVYSFSRKCLSTQFINGDADGDTLTSLDPFSSFPNEKKNLNRQQNQNLYMESVSVTDADRNANANAENSINFVDGNMNKEAVNNETNDTITGSGTCAFTTPLEESNRTSLLFELTDRIGVLHNVLRFFWKYDVNVTRIESRPSKFGKFDFFVDLEGTIGDENVDLLLRSLKGDSVGIRKILILDEKQVNWFPRHISELDLIANRTLDAGSDLEADHPGFHDAVYRSRREDLAKFSQDHKWDQPIAHIDYTDDEIHCWRTVWDRMEPLAHKYACKEYKHALDLMKEHCGFRRDAIPQQAAISSFLQSRTNFELRPVAGLLSSRDFLNGLAYRVFFCTQYIRHPSKPLYTPEPDICHELLGHAPMFANRDFCDFSQEIGLASLGASDEDIEKLARCYWFSVEFGLCKESVNNVDGDGGGGEDQIRAYGAGLLSSFGELEHACGWRDHDNEGEDEDEGRHTRPQIKPWDPISASMQDFPITTYQPVYFLAESLQDAKVKMRSYCEDLKRPFFAQYNQQTQTVFIDRPVRRKKIDNDVDIGDAASDRNDNAIDEEEDEDFGL